jgi:hypothetical protein
VTARAPPRRRRISQSRHRNCVSRQAGSGTLAPPYRLDCSLEKVDRSFKSAVLVTRSHGA